MSDVPAYRRFLAELKRRHVFRIMAVNGASFQALIPKLESQIEW
jgi:ethanolamine utilization protein EutP (predicted NTPase)